MNTEEQAGLVQGMVLKSVGGLYQVKTGNDLVSCRARGILRKQEVSPCAGDQVMISLEIGGTGVIEQVLERRNYLIRPPLANLDQMVFVISTCEPSPNYLVLDKFVAICEFKGIAPALAVTKVDLGEGSEILSIYQKAGIPVAVVDYTREESLAPLYQMLDGKLSAFTGNSGVGKSTLLNHLDPSYSLETNGISKKLGRGKHTTRQVELYPLKSGGFVADTPGFSSLDVQRYDWIQKESLADCFREFSQLTGQCRFQDCSHTCEVGCAVLEAVKRGEVPVSRHASYLEMYQEASQLHEWERKKQGGTPQHGQKGK